MWYTMLTVVGHYGFKYVCPSYENLWTILLNIYKGSENWFDGGIECCEKSKWWNLVHHK
jgi:hypothetical protein